MVPTWGSPPRRGLLVALVGPDGSGKTTLAQALIAALSVELGAGTSVATVHLGGPPGGTRLTSPIQTGIRGIRKVPRMIRGERDLAGVEDRYPTLQALLDLCTAVDRRLLVRQCHQAVESGSLILADRFPGRVPGSASGPRPPPPRGILARWLHRIEQRVYQGHVVPDLLVRLEVPVEITVQRNAARPQPKPESVIVASHAAAALLAFPGVPEVRISTLAPLASSVAEVMAGIREIRGGTPEASVEDGSSGLSRRAGPGRDGSASFPA